MTILSQKYLMSQHINHNDIKKRVSNKYGCNVESISKLTYSENIAYLCTKHISSFKKEMEMAQKLMDMEKVCLYWVDDRLDNEIRREIELYCKKLYKQVG